MAQQTEPIRIDETQKRLLDWSYGQPPSERLAAQVLDAEGYEDIDPSHPLGGPDGGRDGHCTRDGENGVWAVFFPRGQQSFKEIEDKFKADIAAARKHAPKFIAFVTNQELRLSERAVLREHGGDIKVEVFHLERVAGVLDESANQQPWSKQPRGEQCCERQARNHLTLGRRGRYYMTRRRFANDIRGALIRVPRKADLQGL